MNMLVLKIKGSDLLPLCVLTVNDGSTLFPVDQ